MHHFITVVAVVLGLAATVSAKITCYRGINIIMPGNANFSQSMASLGCNNANFCLRSFGTFNGQDGWFSTCAADDTCSSYPACTTTTGGAGNYSTKYTSCCCKTDLCNNLSFTGDGDGGNTGATTAAQTGSSASVSANSDSTTSTSVTATTSNAPTAAVVMPMFLLSFFFSFLLFVS